MRKIFQQRWVPMLGLWIGLGAIVHQTAETAAKKHCPGDEIVWGNVESRSGAYHLKGNKNYGTTKDGAYACRGELEKAGWHEAKNKQ